MPLSEKQREALPALRDMFANNPADIGRAMPFEERVRLPPAADVPDDITVSVEIAPPLSAPLPLVYHSALKRPDRVPVFFYALRNDSAPSLPAQTKVILYIHGGGNIQSHPTEDLYVNLFAAMLRATSAAAGKSAPCVVIAPCYRLATVPENAFPAALQDVLAAYDYVIGRGYKPSNITIAGDSAGGNHALVLTHVALYSNRPSPHGVVAISPQSIQAYDSLSEEAKAQTVTDLLSLKMYRAASRFYVRNTGYAPTDPLVSGSLIPFTEAWPKTLILLGTGDTLVDAARLLERRLADAKRPVELVEYDELPHGWWLVPSVFPQEVADAARRIARFVQGPEYSRL